MLREAAVGGALPAEIGYPEVLGFRDANGRGRDDHLDDLSTAVRTSLWTVWPELRRPAAGSGAAARGTARAGAAPAGDRRPSSSPVSDRRRQTTIRRRWSARRWCRCRWSGYGSWSTPLPIGPRSIEPIVPEAWGWLVDHADCCRARRPGRRDHSRGSASGQHLVGRRPGHRVAGPGVGAAGVRAGWIWCRSATTRWPATSSRAHRRLLAAVRATVGSRGRARSPVHRGRAGVPIREVMVWPAPGPDPATTIRCGCWGGCSTSPLTHLLLRSGGGHRRADRREPTSQSVFTQATWSRSQPRTHGSFSLSPSSRVRTVRSPTPYGVESDQPGSADCPRQVVALRHDDHPVDPVDVAGSHAGVVGVQAVPVQLQPGIGRSPGVEQVVVHGGRLVVLGCLSVARQQQPVRRSRACRRARARSSRARRNRDGIPLG